MENLNMEKKVIELAHELELPPGFLERDDWNDEYLIFPPLNGQTLSPWQFGRLLDAGRIVGNGYCNIKDQDREIPINYETSYRNAFPFNSYNGLKLTTETKPKSVITEGEGGQLEDFHKAKGFRDFYIQIIREHLSKVDERRSK